MSQREIIEFLKNNPEWFTVKRLAMCLGYTVNRTKTNLSRMMWISEIVFKFENNKYIYKHR
ncbi:MAG: hypothetical protein QQN41_11515 [Nitrosopumilus sp.]